MTIIHPIKLSISNCFLVEGSKKILVDTGSPGEGPRIVKALKSHGVDLSDISLILHTHGHSDHCGSTRELVQQHDIPTAVHSADAHMTEMGKNDVLRPTRTIARIIKPFVNRPYPAFKADILIDAYTDLSEFGINGNVYSTRGHTKGSISIVFDNREAIIGDLMMGGYMGGAFLPNMPDYHYFANDIRAINASIRRILNTDADVFHVGHGGPLKREQIIKKIASQSNFGSGWA